MAKMIFFDDIKKGNILLNYSKFKEKELHEFSKDNLIIGPWHSRLDMSFYIGFHIYQKD